MKLTMQVLRCGAAGQEQFARTANVSSNGVLFHSDLKAAPGDPLEYVLTLTPEVGARKAVRIHCLGKVVRRTENESTAATLERYEFMRG